MFEYQQGKKYFAQVQRGLEDLAAEELKELGAKECLKTYTGVYFSCDRQTLYKINYNSRIISRVLAPLFSFACLSDKMLYKRALAMNWTGLFNHTQSFAIKANVSNSNIKHSKFAALRLKDAIADHFRQKTNKRPDVSTQNPDIWFNLNLRDNKAVISLDTSHGSLHKRGYHKETVSAPLAETLAAAIIRYSGWDGSKPLVDPMCGSGTLLAEAIMHCCSIPAGKHKKKYGFSSLPDYDPKLWDRVKKKYDQNIKPLKQGLVSGNDIDAQAVKASRINLNLVSGSKTQVRVTRKDYKDLANINDSMIITNLPYGVRMEAAGLESFYREFGDFLKHKCTGSEAWLLCGSNDLVKKIGLRTSRRIRLFNGPIEARLIQLQLY